MTSFTTRVPTVALHDGAAIPQLGFDVFDFNLSDDEMASIAALDAGDRTGPDPDEFVRP